MNFVDKTVTEISGTFHVPPYQRGYRWTPLEVERLLNDIAKRKNRANSSYSIQPIVVLPRGNEEYELVDGQQRLTTLFLILTVLKIHVPTLQIKFKIDYDTRKDTTKYLQFIESHQTEEIEKNKNLTIDCWHIYNAYKTIICWLEAFSNPALEAIELFTDMGKHVKVLWYETDDQDGHALFERLNIGRIPLTNAELIKALFLNRQTMLANPELRQNEIATQWDNMEQELRNKDLWAFINRENKQGEASRLDFIFKLMAGKSDPRDPYGTFFYFNDRINEKLAQGGSPQEVWDEIRKFFLLIKEWFENRTLYNYAGFLIAEDHNISIKKLIDETRGKSKSERLNILENKIADIIKLPTEDMELASLQYGSNDALIRAILLWFNIKTMEKNEERFPFARYKDPKSSWSLEHIHARNSKGLSTQEEWKEWLRLNIEALESMPENNEELLAEAQEALQQTSLKGSTFENLFTRITEKLSDNSSDEAPDSIVNLALLQADANAALSNSPFKTKRGKLIELDKKGHFIPVCTRNVFMKYYSPEGKNLPYFWGADDRQAYLDEIRQLLYPQTENSTVDWK